MDLIQISQNILIVGGALIIILWVIAMLYIIMILIKINSILSDVKEKYNIVTGFLFKPFVVIETLISKFIKVFWSF